MGWIEKDADGSERHYNDDGYCYFELSPVNPETQEAMNRIFARARKEQRYTIYAAICSVLSTLAKLVFVMMH